MREAISNILSMSSEFVPVVVKATMKALTAGALHRDLNDREADEIVKEVAGCTDRFLNKLRSDAPAGRFSDGDIEELREYIHGEILMSAWALVQMVTDEMRMTTKGDPIIDEEKTYGC